MLTILHLEQGKQNLQLCITYLALLLELAIVHLVIFTRTPTTLKHYIYSDKIYLF